MSRKPNWGFINLRNVRPRIGVIGAESKIPAGASMKIKDYVTGEVDVIYRDDKNIELIHPYIRIDTTGIDTTEGVTNKGKWGQVTLTAPQSHGLMVRVNRKFGENFENIDIVNIKNGKSHSFKFWDYTTGEQRGSSIYYKQAKLNSIEVESYLESEFKDIRDDWINWKTYNIPNYHDIWIELSQLREPEYVPPAAGESTDLENISSHIKGGGYKQVVPKAIRVYGSGKVTFQPKADIVIVKEDYWYDTRTMDESSASQVAALQTIDIKKGEIKDILNDYKCFDENGLPCPAETTKTFTQLHLTSVGGKDLGVKLYDNPITPFDVSPPPKEDTSAPKVTTPSQSQEPGAIVTYTPDQPKSSWSLPQEFKDTMMTGVKVIVIGGGAIGLLWLISSMLPTVVDNMAELQEKTDRITPTPQRRVIHRTRSNGQLFRRNF